MVDFNDNQHNLHNNIQIGMHITLSAPQKQERIFELTKKMSNQYRKL